MPSDIQRAQNLTTKAIVTILGRLGIITMAMTLSTGQLSHFHLSECHLARYPSIRKSCSGGQKNYYVSDPIQMVEMNQSQSRQCLMLHRCQHSGQQFTGNPWAIT